MDELWRLRWRWRMKEREERRECSRDGDDDGYWNKGGRRVVDPKIRGDQRQAHHWMQQPISHSSHHRRSSRWLSACYRKRKEANKLSVRVCNTCYLFVSLVVSTFWPSSLCCCIFCCCFICRSSFSLLSSLRVCCTLTGSSSCAS
jgi:hypothetical protein